MSKSWLRITTVGLLVLIAQPARAEFFIAPMIGFNFGGDSGSYCATLSNCDEHRTNFGVSLGSMGPVLGIEEDISVAKNFFGDAPGVDNSVFSAMTNLLAGVGAGPIQPYVLAGVGLIRPHASFGNISGSNNAFGWDIGGGAVIYPSSHVGFRGDVRHFRTAQDIDVFGFSGQPLQFWRGSLGLSFRF